ncbi:MAG: glucosamine-6-phosphate deaminase [Deltaproteobacteria bacterium]|nr:glucosamine-6-phosphate deaminase [Deltaproteobacteria bacterium]
MKISVLPNDMEMARIAAKKAAEFLKDAITQKGHATFVAATGASQLNFLKALASDPEIDWAKTTMFHLDEYIGLPETHPASFRLYLKERLVQQVHPGEVHLIRGDASDPQAECRRLNQLIAAHEIDVSFIGIGENGHIAFNDPPADFDVEDPFIIVALDDACRRQQFTEGWFSSLDEVPEQAISMSIKQIMKSNAIICTVPDQRKAKAVQECFTGEVVPSHPASILRRHENTHVYLDTDAAFL